MVIVGKIDLVSQVHVLEELFAFSLLANFLIKIFISLSRLIMVNHKANFSSLIAGEGKTVEIPIFLQTNHLFLCLIVLSE